MIDFRAKGATVQVRPDAPAVQAEAAPSRAALLRAVGRHMQHRPGAARQVALAISSALSAAPQPGLCAHVQRFSIHHKSLFPRIVAAREHYFCTSHLGQPFCAWDSRHAARRAAACPAWALTETSSCSGAGGSGTHSLARPSACVRGCPKQPLCAPLCAEA